MSTLYERIMALCKQKGVSGSKMCLDLGMSKSTMSELKAGRAKGVSATTAQKIASYFGVSVEYLLGDCENNEKKPDADTELSEYLEYLKNRPEMRMLFSTLKGATKEDVERAVKIIEALRGDTNG